MYETMLWKEKERPKIRAVQIDNFKGLLGIWRIDRAPNARLRKLSRLMKACCGGSAMWRGWRLIGLSRESI